MLVSRPGFESGTGDLVWTSELLVAGGGEGLRLGRWGRLISFSLMPTPTGHISENGSRHLSIRISLLDYSWSFWLDEEKCGEPCPKSMFPYLA